jgi:hypothetical protein
MRRAVVDIILNLAGYTFDWPLHRQRHLEPAFGDGHLLVPAIEGLLAAWQATSNRTGNPVGDFSCSLCAVELHELTFEGTGRKVIELPAEKGIACHAATTLADHCLIHGGLQKLV